METADGGGRQGVIWGISDSMNTRRASWMAAALLLASCCTQAWAAEDAKTAWERIYGPRYEAADLETPAYEEGDRVRAGEASAVNAEWEAR